MAGMISDGSEGSGDEPMAAINVTSLIDVMFCLLIGFMVATPLMSKEKLEIDIPNAKGAEISEEEFLYTVVSVDAKGQVFLGVTPLSSDKAKMTQELANNVKIKEEGRAFIQGDKGVAYEKVMDVMVALKEAGVEKVGFVSDPRTER